MKHQDIPIAYNHKPHKWEYADATAREAATGLVAGDVGNDALQLDNFSRWTLSDDSPVTWVSVGDPTGAVAAEQLRAETAEGNLADAINAAIEGLSWKSAVRAATTADITLSGAQTIDGVSIIADDRVLVKNQSAPEENGIYVCAAGSWARAADMSIAAEFPSATVAVQEGSTLQDTSWTCSTNAPITVDTTAITWVQTGTAGAGDMVLASAQTVTGAKTFEDATLILEGLTSGTTTVKAAAVAGTTTVTLPAATDTLVGKATTDTLTNKRLTPRSATTTSSGTPTINTDNTDIFTITAQAAAITSFTTNLSGTPTNGEMLMIRIKDDGTARAITWGASFASRGATLPTTTVLSKTLYVLLIWNSTASTWDCISTAQET